MPVSVVVAKYFAADEHALQEAQARLEDINGKIEELEAEEDYEDTPEYNELKKQEKATKAEIKALLKCLTDEVVAKYAALTEDEIRNSVVEDKWLATLSSRMEGEMARVSQEMTTTVLNLQHRYERTLPQIEQSVFDAEKAVKEYLKQMGME